MSPFHQGYVRELRTTTALVNSMAWRASEDIREQRDKSGEHYTVAEPIGIREQIATAILLSGVKRNLEEKVN